MQRPALLAAAFAACAVTWFAPSARAVPQPGHVRAVYRSPFELAFSPDGRTLAVSDRTAGVLALVEVAKAKVTEEIALRGNPAGVAWSADGRRIYVAECTAGSVAEVDLSGKITRRFEVGPWPVGLGLVPKRGWLLAANSATDTVSAVELTNGREKIRIGVTRTPYFLAVTPDEKLAVVGNRLPAGDASRPSISAVVTLIDLGSLTKAADVALPPNSINVHGVAVSPDSRWAYVVHNLGRAVLPTEQIEYGWINANAMTIIDLAGRKRYATILLDRSDAGAANPWAAVISKDGETLWVTFSGIHQLGRLNLGKLHERLRAELPKVAQRSKDGQGPDNNVRGAMVYSAAGQTGADDPAAVELVISDLPVDYGQGLYLRGVLSRSELPGNGPRGLALSPDGRRLAAALYFTGSVAMIDPNTARPTELIPLGEQPEADEIRRGEMVFHDAKHCFQHWLSCATCHPEGRADGLNWDLLNDGIGSPKNTRSLLLSHKTPPAMSRGVRPNMEAAAEAGFKFILFQKPKPEDLHAVEAYLRALEPAQSPYLVGDRLSEKTRRGKAVFESPETRCAACHPGPLYTDLKIHNVGTREELDGEDRTFDTPTLIELWRTPPYLHHGRATALREVVTKYNRDGRHGRTSHLTTYEIDALVEYLRSL